MKKAAAADKNGVVSTSSADGLAQKYISICVGIGHSNDASLMELKDIGEGASAGSSVIFTL